MINTEKYYAVRHQLSEEMEILWGRIDTLLANDGPGISRYAFEWLFGNYENVLDDYMSLCADELGFVEDDNAWRPPVPSANASSFCWGGPFCDDPYCDCKESD